MFGGRIRLDRELLDRARDHARRAGYASLEEFVAHAVEKELARREGGTADSEDRLRERLKGLGYL